MDSIDFSITAMRLCRSSTSADTELDPLLDNLVVRFLDFGSQPAEHGLNILVGGWPRPRPLRHGHY